MEALKILEKVAYRNKDVFLSRRPGHGVGLCMFGPVFGDENKTDGPVAVCNALIKLRK